MSIKEQREINQDHKGSYFREIFRKTLCVYNTLNRAEAVFVRIFLGWQDSPSPTLPKKSKIYKLKNSHLECVNQRCNILVTVKLV